MTYVFQVSGDVVRRLREQLDAERPVAGQDWADLPAPAAAEPVQVEEQEVLVEVPARVCPATKSVPQHKDKQDGKGASVSSWISVVYLTHQPGSALVLVDDVTGREFRVAIEPGRLCCWPNARFSHRVDVDMAVAVESAVAIDSAVAADAVAAQVAALANFRCMLGPMAFSQRPGPGLSGKEILTGVRVGSIEGTSLSEKRALSFIWTQAGGCSCATSAASSRRSKRSP